MSRLIVKNLPKSTTEEKLRAIFSQKGTITDIQLKYTKDGVFRQFAFIGYLTEKEAEGAIQYFNNSCIQTNRIKVEKCTALGANEKPKSWSKHSIDSSAYRKKHGLDILEEQEREKKRQIAKANAKKDAIDKIFGEYKDDPEFNEFLEVHDKNRTLWGNDASLTEKDDNPSDWGVVSLNDVNDNQIESKNMSKKMNKIKVSSDDDENAENDEEDDNDEDDKDNNSDENVENVKVADKNISDLEYMKSLMKKQKNEKKEKKDLDLYTIKMMHLPYKIKRQNIINFFKPNKPYSVRIPAKIHGICYVGFKTEKEFKKAMLKDKSFIKGKQIFLIDVTEQSNLSKSKLLSSIEEISEKNPKWAKQEESLKNEEDISESGRIFFRNLAYTVTEDDLQQLFERYGPIAEINLPVDPYIRQIKGFGTVTFVMPEHAVKAFTELDGTIFHGRLLHLIPGKNKDNNTDDEEDTEGMSFKVKKQLKLKKSAQESHNWNTLFLGADAVAEILAKQFGETKETILDTKRGGSSAAVRLALGETQIISEMKKFLEENDVELDVFNDTPKKRSKTVILAKNLPPGTTVAELKPLFCKYGLLGRIVLPPSGVTAIIEFYNSSEAREAFKKLAYSKFKNLPLYLEWAPENSFKTAPNGISNSTREKGEEKRDECENNKEKDSLQNNKINKKDNEDRKNENNVLPKVEEQKENVEEDDEYTDEPPEDRTTIFLRNLNFKTRENAIREHFKHLGPIHTVQVAMKKDPENPQNRISLGYGFIQFKKKESANRALKEMTFTQIEGNQVELKPSDRVLKTNVKTNRKPMNSSKQTGTKILVKNIPFQTKPKEIQELFQAFGNIKAIRLPKKLTPGENEIRGFGFVDFFDKSTARKAFEALCHSTHLYGRRLRLEWAETDDQSVDELRKRTAKNFVGSEIQAKKSKKAIFDSSGTKVDDDDMNNEME